MPIEHYDPTNIWLKKNNFIQGDISLIRSDIDSRASRIRKHETIEIKSKSGELHTIEHADLFRFLEDYWISLDKPSELRSQKYGALPIPAGTFYIEKRQYESRSILSFGKRE